MCIQLPHSSQNVHQPPPIFCTKIMMMTLFKFGFFLTTSSAGNWQTGRWAAAAALLLK